MSLAKCYGVKKVPTVAESVPALLSKFEDVFDWVEALPPSSIEHHTHLKKGPYWVLERIGPCRIYWNYLHLLQYTQCFMFHS